MAVALLHPLELFGSFDGPTMRLQFAATFVFGLVTIAWLWTRFIKIWSLLRFLLETLEGSPLRFAFSRLPRTFSLDSI